MTRFNAFLALVAVGAVVGTACGLLAPANSPRAVKFDCQEAALRPVLGEILDTKAFLRDLYAGKADLGAALAAIGATQAEVRAVVKALQACEAPADAGEPDATELTPS